MFTRHRARALHQYTQTHTERGRECSAIRKRIETHPPPRAGTRTLFSLHHTEKETLHQGTPRKRRGGGGALLHHPLLPPSLSPHRILARPLPGGLLVPGPVSLVDVGDLRDERVVRVRVAEQGADGEEHLGERQRGRPLLLQDVQAYGSLGVDVRVVDLWAGDGGWAGRERERGCEVERKKKKGGGQQNTPRQRKSGGVQPAVAATHARPSSTHAWHRRTRTRCSIPWDRGARGGRGTAAARGQTQNPTARRGFLLLFSSPLPLSGTGPWAA